VVSFTARPLYPQGKSPWYPLDRRLGKHSEPDVSVNASCSWISVGRLLWGW